MLSVLHRLVGSAVNLGVTIHSLVVPSYHQDMFDVQAPMRTFGASEPETLRHTTFVDETCQIGTIFLGANEWSSCVVTSIFRSVNVAVHVMYLLAFVQQFLIATVGPFLFRGCPNCDESRAPRPVMYSWSLNSLE